MYRYHMKLLVRPETREGWEGREGPEQEVKCNVTADNEQQARRIAMAIAWSSQALVSRFTSVKRGKVIQ